MHNNQLFSPFLNIFPIPPPPPLPPFFPNSLSNALPLLHLSHHEPQTPDYFETTVFGTRAKKHEISYGNLTTTKKYVVTMGLGLHKSPAFFNITSLPSLQHIITNNPNPPLNASITKT
jgi:hypothetical protein